MTRCTICYTEARLDANLCCADCDAAQRRQAEARDAVVATACALVDTRDVGTQHHILGVLGDRVQELDLARSVLRDRYRLNPLLPTPDRVCAGAFSQEVPA